MAEAGIVRSGRARTDGGGTLSCRIRFMTRTPVSRGACLSRWVAGRWLRWLHCGLHLGRDRVAMAQTDHLEGLPCVTHEMPAGGAEHEAARPDDTARRLVGGPRPRFGGTMTYRVDFDRSTRAGREQLVALYIERVCATRRSCSTASAIVGGGAMVTAGQPQLLLPELVTLPAGLLEPRAATGSRSRSRAIALEQVAARQRGGGLSELVVGPQEELRPRHDEAPVLERDAARRSTGATIAVLGVLHAGGGLGQRAANRPTCYFGVMLHRLGPARRCGIWLRDLPMDHCGHSRP